MSDYNLFAQLRFRWPWRPYQARVLAAVEKHLTDRKLHVVAAPGSGKTSLGLEVFRRLAKPALVLSPTKTIRDQWIYRLSDFLPEGFPVPPPWVSKELEQPALLTSITYQALHSSVRASLEGMEEDSNDDVNAGPPTKKEITRIARRLTRAQVGTLILDEAHHLRAEWWRALDEIVDLLPRVTVVALTATPPYGSTGIEWQRYLELCGPIDEEISAPELVRAGTLCPHQDFVYMVEPAEDESLDLQRYEDSAARTTAEVVGDPLLLEAVRAHPWVQNPITHLDGILDDPELAVAMFVFLKASDEPLPRRLLDLLDTSARDLPRPGRRWLQVLLRGYLFRNDWPDSESFRIHRDALSRRLRREGLLWRRELRLLESRPLKTRLSLSKSKVSACLDIYRLERALRGADLRHVVLADFIRDEELNHALSKREPVLGAWPIFHAFVTSSSEAEARRMCLLTGRLVVLPRHLVAEMESQLQHVGGSLSTTTLQGLPHHVRLSIAGDQRMTHAITGLLDAGRLHVLVGTRALLGEGWDAPCVNSLTLASFVGSFMMTNQMRGRAIRVDPARPDKAASVWHVVAVEPGTSAGKADLEDLGRRFETFVGLANTKPSIESGLSRLSLQPTKRSADLQANNNEMTRRLQGLSDLNSRWREAITRGHEGRVLPSVRATRPPTIRPFILRRTLRYFLQQTLFSFMSAWGGLLRNADWRSNRWDALLWIVIITFGLAAFINLPRFLRALLLLFRHLPVDGTVRQIGMALCDALCRSSLVETDRSHLQLKTTRLDDGSISVSLLGGTFFEQSRFADCLGELLSPIANPRYLITRGRSFLGRSRYDNHAVPHALGTHKERALTLLAAWKRRVGPAKLIYTRHEKGRHILLRARSRSFVTAASPPIERYDRWE